jgi:hypothetical protein
MTTFHTSRLSPEDLNSGSCSLDSLKQEEFAIPSANLKKQQCKKKERLT